MKKMALFILLSIGVASCAGQSVDLSHEVRRIILTGENVFFENVGSSTTKALTSLKGEIDSCEFREHSGDLSGNSGATNLVLVKCESGSSVIVRVKREWRQKFHILGFATHESLIE